MSQSRRPYTAKIGADAIVERADGSRINFGDAIYHPENVEEAMAYAASPDAAGLDQAWVGLAQALPSGRFLRSIELDLWKAADGLIEYVATVGTTQNATIEGTGDTPAAALAALRAAIEGGRTRGRWPEAAR